MELGDAPLPASLDHDESVGKIGGRDADGATRITHHKGEAAHSNVNDAPTALVSNGDAFAAIDERPVVLVFKDLWRINTPLDGEIRRRIATKGSKAQRLGRRDR